jgi:hypothetical protein
MHEWPDECVWKQLQYECWQQDRDPSNYTSTLYMANLEKEWARRGICWRCHREIDRGLDEQMSRMETRAHDAEEKLRRIRSLIAVTPDIDLRPMLMSILDEQ